MAMRCFIALWMMLGGLLPHARAQTDPRGPGNAAFADRAEKNYEAARVRFQTDSNNPEAAWQLARACFDWADYVTTDTKRAKVAEEGIAAARHFLKSAITNSVPGHYYLALNLGQLARTKSLGALKLVTQMESEFNIVLALEPDFDFAGADRNLGLLYLDAPGWPLSIGSKSRARQHLQTALKRAPEFPDNHLNLMEAELLWGNNKDAASGLAALNELWPEARKKLAGDEWATDWADWEKRRDAAEKKVRASLKTTPGGR